MWYGDEIRRSAYWCVDEIAHMFADHPPTQRAVYEAGERIVDFIRTREQVPMIGPVSQPHLQAAKLGYAYVQYCVNIEERPA